MEMQNLKYSLVIGAYNPNLDWLREAIESADGLFDENIIVDDGSSVMLSDILTCADLKIIRHAQNKGFYEARNSGIKISSGDVVVSLDSDDLFIRENVLKLKEFAKENDSDVWHFPIKEFDRSNGEWGESVVDENLYDRNQIPSGSWFKRSIWEEVGGFQIPKAEDWDFWLRCYRAGKRFTYFPRNVYLHRIHGNNKSYHENFEEIREIIRGRNPK
ncbi:MAG: glycosyltransferase family 2 protein [Nitrospiria bacterium]